MEFAKAFPQEWASLAPALEYLCETAPRGSHGLSAFDITQGYALASDVDRQLVPFRILPGQADSEVAQKLFEILRSYMEYSRELQLKMRSRNKMR